MQIPKILAQRNRLKTLVPTVSMLEYKF